MTLSPRALWIGLLIPPLAWFASFEANFAVAPLACMGYGKTALYAVSAVALALAASATGIAWNARHRLQGPPAARAGIAIAAIGLGSLFTLAILAQAIPNLLMAGCD